MNYPSAIVVTGALIAGAIVLSSGSQANHPHRESAHIVAHDDGVWHMHGHQLRSCGFVKQEGASSKSMRCDEWQ